MDVAPYGVERSCGYAAAGWVGDLARSARSVLRFAVLAPDARRRTVVGRSSEAPECRWSPYTNHSVATTAGPRNDWTVSRRARAPGSWSEGLCRHWLVEVDAADRGPPGRHVPRGRRGAAACHELSGPERFVHSVVIRARWADPRSESDRYDARLPLEGCAHRHANPSLADFDERQNSSQGRVADRSTPHDSRSVVAHRRRDEARDFERAPINATKGSLGHDPKGSARGVRDLAILLDRLHRGVYCVRAGIEIVDERLRGTNGRSRESCQTRSHEP